MATRVRQQQPQHRRTREDAGAGERTAATRETRDSALKQDLDDLLDEIDEVLEENAEEFVKAYVQKGGQ